MKFIKNLLEKVNDLLDPDRKEIRMDNHTNTAREVLGFPGAMISGSKSGYREAYPKNLVVFNSNVCTRDGKIWYGDLDITKSWDKLQTLANALGKEIYVLYEMHGRFENEDRPLIEQAVAKFSPEE